MALTSSLSVLLYSLLLPLLSHSKSLPINVWPKPTKTHWPKPTACPLSPHFTIHSPSPLHPHLTPAISRFSSLLSSTPSPSIVSPSVESILIDFQPLVSLNLFISDLSSPLQHAVDESYTLSISSGTASLTSVTVWGALHGLETFSQLTWSSNPVLVATEIFISDRPMFPHRGLMLDTARNYFPVRDIKRTIEAMAMNKMNVFHWHVTDGQSFPMVLPSERGLAEKGAYGEGMRYEVEDVREVVEYGMRRGVRVMPEIDVPAQTGSWAEAYPEIIACANKFWLPDPHDWSTRLASEPATGHLNPLHPKTYQVLANVIADVASLFPEDFYHSGADEVNPGCWSSDPTIQSFLSDGGTLSQVLEIFINKTLPLITSLGKTAVYWEDVLLDPAINVHPSFLPTESTILQAWNNGPRNTKRIVQAGYRVIVSSSDFYYLDCGHGGWVGNDSQYDTLMTGCGIADGSWCTPFKTWQRIYDYDIVDGLSEEEARLVIGGEVVLWSEQADWTVLDARLWPRTAAMAEALWSGDRDEKGRKTYAEATERLNKWRYKMVERGIRAEPLQPLWCLRNPGMCNTNS